MPKKTQAVVARKQSTSSVRLGSSVKVNKTSKRNGASAISKPAGQQRSAEG
jgi:hypothetical protein